MQLSLLELVLGGVVVAVGRSVNTGVVGATDFVYEVQVGLVRNSSVYLKKVRGYFP